MFDVKEFADNDFKMYELVDVEHNSTVKICPERGGIVTSFNVKGEEVFYLDKETFYDVNKNIRGGNPILFPLCGQLPNQKYSLNGKEYFMKNHGLARISKWEVIGRNTDVCASIKLSFKSSEETLKSYPFEFEVQLEYVLKDNKLTINQQYINKSDKVMPMSIGFHPYFKVKDKNKITYDVNATKYLDKDDLKVKDYHKDSLDMVNKVEANILMDHKGSKMSFSMEDLDRRIIFDYSEVFKYIVVWSVPGSDFMCVEPWSSKGGAFYPDNDLLEVSSNDKLDLSYAITVE